MLLLPLWCVVLRLNVLLLLLLRLAFCYRCGQMAEAERKMLLQQELHTHLFRKQYRPVCGGVCGVVVVYVVLLWCMWCCGWCMWCCDDVCDVVVG